MTDLPGLGTFLSHVHPKGQMFEIRLLGSHPRTCSGLFDDPILAYDAVCRAAKVWPMMNFYYTLNPIDPDCELARGTKRNVIRPRPRATAKDADILNRTLCMIDIDPQRPTDTSSTVSERSLAKDLTRNVRGYLSNQGWPKPILVSSGNGYQLLYRMAQVPSTSTCMRSALENLAKKFDTDFVHIDRCVHNAARIARLPWTINRKGDSTAERPHRRSKVLSLGEANKIDERMVAPLAEGLGELNLGLQGQRQTRARAASSFVFHQRRRSDFPECLLSEAEVHQLIELYRDVLPLKAIYRVGQGIRFQLAICPMKGAPHRKQTVGTGKTAIFWGPGVLGFKCFSDDCCSASIGGVLKKLAAQTGRRFWKPVWRADTKRGNLGTSVPARAA